MAQRRRLRSLADLEPVLQRWDGGPGTGLGAAAAGAGDA